MGRLGIPFIFGPVGGGERTPIRLRMDYGVHGHVLDAVRDLANILAIWNPWLHETLDTARLVLVKTPQTGTALPSKYRHKVRHLIEIGAPQAADSPPPPRRDRALKYLFVGRFLFWKGMQYGLRAFARLLPEVPDARLTMVGDGPEALRWRRLCQTLDITHAVDWPGWIPHTELGPLYRGHDIFLFPSLHDSSGSVVLEAMSYGLPVLCFDLGGPGVLVNSNCGIVIPTDGQGSHWLIASLADAMRAPIHQPERFRNLQMGALARAREMTWASAVKQVYGEGGM